MCYDVSFTVNVKQLSDYFPDLIFDDQIEMNFEAAVYVMGHAYGNHPIIYVNRDDLKLHCRLMEWGVIPFYTKDEKAFVVKSAFPEFNLPAGQLVLSIDERYFRPTEVELLHGDATKAKEKLGWVPKHDLNSLVKEMMASDLELFRKDKYLKQGGHNIFNYHE